MSVLCYFDYGTRRKEALKAGDGIEKLRKYCTDTTESVFDLEDHMKSCLESYKLKQEVQKEWNKLSPVDIFNYYEKVDEICNKEDETYLDLEFTETTEILNNDPIHIILENRLGFQLPIKTELIEDYVIPVTDKCDYFILIMKIKNIEQLEQGAIEFIKKAQIFNVYLVYEDNRKEKNISTLE